AYASTTALYALSLHDALPIYEYTRWLRIVREPSTPRWSTEYGPAVQEQRLILELEACLAAPGQIRPDVVELAHALRLALRCIAGDRKSTRLNSSHSQISYAVF